MTNYEKFMRDFTVIAKPTCRISCATPNVMNIPKSISAKELK